MKDYKRLTERYVEEKGDFLKKGTRLTLKNAPDEEILERVLVCAVHPGYAFAVRLGSCAEKDTR